MKSGNKHPPTIKTGQIWSSDGFKSSFRFPGGAEILYYFFEPLNVLKWKNSKLQSCRSHWELQLWYKKYLHFTPYKKYIIFLMRQVLLWCWNFILFFEQLNVLKLKNLKLESCRYHRDLQFLYKSHLHPTSY